MVELPGVDDHCYSFQARDQYGDYHFELAAVLPFQVMFAVAAVILVITLAIAY